MRILSFPLCSLPKEVHPTEWLILKEADSVASLPAGRGPTSISQGDLEQMVEKELKDGNNQKQSEGIKVFESIPLLFL